MKNPVTTKFKTGKEFRRSEMFVITKHVKKPYNFSVLKNAMKVNMTFITFL